MSHVLFTEVTAEQQEIVAGGGYDYTFTEIEKNKNELFLKAYKSNIAIIVAPITVVGKDNFVASSNVAYAG